MKCKTITEVIAKFDGVEYVKHMTPFKEAGGYFIEVYKYQGGKRIKLDEYAEILGQRCELADAGDAEAATYTVDFGDVPEEDEAADLYDGGEEDPKDYDDDEEFDEMGEDYDDGDEVEGYDDGEEFDEVDDNDGIDWVDGGDGVEGYDEGEEYDDSDEIDGVDGYDEGDEADELSQMQEDKESAGSDWI